MSDEEKIATESVAEEPAPLLDEEIDLDLENEPESATSNGEDVETLKARLAQVEAEKAETEAKNRQLYARIKKARDAEEPKSNESTEDFDDIRSTVQKLSLSERKREFGFEHGLSPKETDAVFKINPNPTKETLNDPFVRGGLQYIRAKERVARATPSSSGRSSAINGRSWGEIVGNKELSKEDKQKNYENMMAKIRK